MISYNVPSLVRRPTYGSLVALSEKCEGPTTTRLCIAIIGAGITGIATACHVLDAGFECRIFESAESVESVGGIWTKVNDTSALQMHSKFYTFHPAVEWESDYPDRAEILSQVRKLWNSYGLASRTTFGCKVTNTYQEPDDKWVVNDSANGYFDGIVPAIGTCGEASTPSFAGQALYEGEVLHSSRLDRKAAKAVDGKDVLIIGGGASAVEALEFAVDNGAQSVKVLARSERWFIPRVPRLNACMAGLFSDCFGILAVLVEFLLRWLFYRDLVDMSPPSNTPGSGIFDSTPIVNSRVFHLIREGRASWVRGDVQRFTSNGIKFSRRQRGMAPGLSGVSTIERGDVCILATGFKRPSLSFLPKTCSDGRYTDSSWYLTVFPTTNPTVCATNSNFRNGVASAGGAHIGIYTRLLLVFLLQPSTKPSEFAMKTWVDLCHSVKRTYHGGTFSHVTAGEMHFGVLATILFNPSLWTWQSFVLSGPGVMANVTSNVDYSLEKSSEEAFAPSHSALAERDLVDVRLE